MAWLTDWQIRHLYRLPQAERVKRLEDDVRTPGTTTILSDPLAPPLSAPAGDQPPPKAMMLGVMVSVLGMDPKAASAEYDRQYAAWQAARK